MGVRAFFSPAAVASIAALIVVFVLCTGTASGQATGGTGSSGTGLTSTSSSGDYLGSQGISCGDLGGIANCFVAYNGLNAGYGYGGCAVIPDESEYVPSVGECYFLNASVSATYYTYNAGNGQITKSPIAIPVPNPVPVIKDVLNNNNKYSPYLITCPLPPQPTNTIEYISDPQTFIAGNRCLASALPLFTTVSLTTKIQVTSVGWFVNLAGYTLGSAPSSASQSYNIENIARGTLKNIGYSGQATVKGSPYNISSSYDTNSYIFQPINSSPQQGIWTWTAEYADLRQVQLQWLDLNYNSKNDELLQDGLNAVYGGIDIGITTDLLGIPIPFPVFVGCSFTYNLEVQSKITSVANANVIIPVFNKSLNGTANNYIDVGNYKYSPTSSLDPNANSCYQQMFSAGPSCSVQKTTFSSLGVPTTADTANWFKIGYNASALYNGQTYNNLPVYVRIPNNLDINQLFGYSNYAVEIVCTINSNGHGEATGAACQVVQYIPQSAALASDGSVNTAGIASYIWSQSGYGTNGCGAGVGATYCQGAYLTPVTLVSPHGGSGDACSQALYSDVLYPPSPSGILTLAGDPNGQLYCVEAGYGTPHGGSFSLVPFCPGSSGNNQGAYYGPSCLTYIVASPTPINKIPPYLNISYAVPINRGAAQALLTANVVNSIAVQNVSIFPYFLYNATIPSTYSQFSPSTFLGLSYSLYSPNNYASTVNTFGILSTPVEPYNLYSGAGLLANYSLKPGSSALAALPLPIGPASSNTFYDTFPIVINPQVASSLTIWAQYNAVIPSSGGGPLVPGIITVSQPTVSEGITSQLTLSGPQGGLPPYTYEWYVEPPGATTYSSTGTIDSAIYEFTGYVTGTYNIRVQVFDSNTPQATGNTSSVSVNVQQAQLVAITQGQSTTVTGSSPSNGIAPYGYQWFDQCPTCSAFSQIPGATGTSYPFSTNTLTPVGNWQFQLQVSDSNTPRAVTYNPPITIVVQSIATLTVAPIAASPAAITQGDQTTLSPTQTYGTSQTDAATGGSGSYSYQWYEEAAGSSTYNAIPGAISDVYTFMTSDSNTMPTTPGIYSFILQATDTSVPPLIANSPATSVTVQTLAAAGPSASPQPNQRTFASAPTKSSARGLSLQGTSSTQLTVSPIFASPKSIVQGAYSAIVANQTYSGETEAATGGNPPYTYQWLVELPGSGSFQSSSSASPIYLPYGFTTTGTTQIGNWTFKLQVTDNSPIPQVVDSDTATVQVSNGSVGTNAGNIQLSANVVGMGDVDVLTTTCNSLDTCAVKYCTGVGCNPVTTLSTGTGHATYTCSTLAGGTICSTAGTYTVTGCDLNGASINSGVAVIGSDCTGPVVLYVQGAGLPPPISLPSLCTGSICSYNVITDNFNAGSGYISAVGSGGTYVAEPNTNPVTLNNQLDSATLSASSTHGTLGFGNITNPAFVSESPNGYIFVINYSSSCGFLCFTSTTNAVLFKMKYIPTGDFNYSEYQPNQFAPQGSYPAWLNATSNYFKAAMLADTPSLYITGISQFTSTQTPNWCLFGVCVGGGQDGILGSGVGPQQNGQSPFIPLAAGADYQGDVFMVGAPIYGKDAAGNQYFALAEISSAGTVNVVTNLDQPAGFVPSQEFAVSPGGQFVYLANASWPSINIYSTSANGGFQYVGNIPLSYSNSSYSMNIISYLSNGGPFYNNAIKTAYGGANPPVASMNDIPAFHHPLAITDVQGTLFVVDDWAFGTSGIANTGGGGYSGLGGGGTTIVTNPLGAIWMLRAFQDNGTTEIPLEYSTNNTLIPVSTLPQQINPFQIGRAYLRWPPYGQPLTANISLSSSGTAQTVSICEYTSANGCNAYSDVTGYNSIGPQITATGSVVASSDFLDNKGWAGQSSEDLGISSGFDGSIYLITHDKVAKTPYTELLVLKPNVENYTVTEIGQGVPYQCYTNIGANTPDCITANYIANLYPPLLGMPDSFEYLTGQGGPLQYFSIPSAISALLPNEAATPGAGAYNSAQIFNTGVFPPATLTSSPPCINSTNSGSLGSSGANYNYLATSGISGCALTATSQLRTYVNSTINGYVITPYTISYTLHQSWDFSASSSSSSSGGDCQDSGGNGQCLFELNLLDATLLEGVCDFTPDAQNGATTVYKNWVTNLGSNFVNQTIEGGNMYANSSITQSNYQPNLSDQNLIISPNTRYNLFTNRLLGEIYINQTISPSYAAELGGVGSVIVSELGGNLGVLGGSGSTTCSVCLVDALDALGGLTGYEPMVINASRNYNYTEDVYIQTIDNPLAQGFSSFKTGVGSSLSSWAGVLSFGGCAGVLCAPAYLAENASPTGTSPNNTILGADCGGKGCPGINVGGINVGQLTNLFGGSQNWLNLPPQVGSLTGLAGYYYNDHYLNGNNVFNYSENNQTNYFSLFSLFHRFAYIYGLGLDLSNVPQIYGYNRLVYTYVDRYNNTVYMPLDVDFANTTLVFLNTTTAVNTLNVNQSTINITGTLLYIAPNGIIAPAPVGSTIYLYYNTNLNYYNTSALALLAQSVGGGTASAALGASYYKWAENCAFAPQSSACTTANPLSTSGLAGILEGLTGVSQANLETTAAQALGNMANTVTYHPNYGPSGSCYTEPNSLLTLSQYNCNIYGNAYSSLLPSDIQTYLSQYGGILPATAQGPNGFTQYCVPQYSNGTGFLTSQLGLIGTVTTNSAGSFNDMITACGVGSGRIIAQYYGNPPPEPVYVVQPNLVHSTNSVITALTVGNDVITPEYNYYYAPNVSSSTFQIGSYQLNIGNLYAWVPIIIILILLLASRSALGQSGGIFELFGFAALYDMAASIGLGSGARGKGLRSGYRSGSLPSTTFDRAGNVRSAKKTLAEKKRRVTQQTPPSSGTPVPPGAALGPTGGAVGKVRMASNYERSGRPAVGPKVQSAGGPMPAAGIPQVTAENLSTTLKTINESNFYTFLGMSTMPKSMDEVKAAYRNQMQNYHPDVAGSTADATARSAAINKANEIAKKKFASQ